MLWCTPFSAFVYPILKLAVFICWTIFLFVEIQIISAMKMNSAGKADVLIVLGAQVRGRSLSRSLKLRLDEAIAYKKRYPGIRIIVSGGRGEGEEISEAEAMAQYLICNEVNPSDIMLENKSVSTWENLKLSRQFVDTENDIVGIVTNDFHIYRAGILARRAGYTNIVGVPAPSDPVYQLNYLVREFFAVLSIWICRNKNE